VPLSTSFHGSPEAIRSHCIHHTTDVYIFFWIPYWPRILINILWPPLDANQYGGPSWRIGSIFSCCKGLWDVFLPKPITTKHQSVFWLVSQSRRMSAICVGSCRWISLAAACADPVHHTIITDQVKRYCSCAHFCILQY